MIAGVRYLAINPGTATRIPRPLTPLLRTGYEATQQPFNFPLQAALTAQHPGSPGYLGDSYSRFSNDSPGIIANSPPTSPAIVNLNKI